MTIRATSLIALLLVVAFAGTAGADEPELAWSDLHGPVGQARSVVFVGDGYRAQERPEYERRVRAFIDALENDPHSMVHAHPEGFNFHAVWVPSSEPVPSMLGTPAHKTAFQMHADYSGILQANNGAADRAALVAPAVDVVVIIGHMDHDSPDPAASRLRANADLPTEGSRVRINENATQALTHELGHAIYSLGDEYGEFGTAVSPAVAASIPLFPNLTCDPAGKLFEPIVPGPYFEGGARYARGVYHAEKTCRMNDAWSLETDFCAVCRARLATVDGTLEGLPDVKGPPATPRIVSPTAGAVVKARDKTDHVVIHVAPGDGGEHADKLRLEVAFHDKGTRAVVFSRTLEPGEAFVPLPFWVYPGARYQVSLVARNRAGRSSAAEATFTVAFEPAARRSRPAPHRGIIDAIPGR